MRFFGFRGETLIYDHLMPSLIFWLRTLRRLFVGVWIRSEVARMESGWCQREKPVKTGCNGDPSILGRPKFAYSVFTPFYSIFAPFSAISGLQIEILLWQPNFCWKVICLVGHGQHLSPPTPQSKVDRGPRRPHYLQRRLRFHPFPASRGPPLGLAECKWPKNVPFDVGPTPAMISGRLGTLLYWPKPNRRPSDAFIDILVENT